MRIVSLLNLFLLSLNLAALGTIVYKTRASEEGSAQTGAIGDVLRLTPEQSEAIELRRASFAEDSERIGSELETVREELLDAVRRDATEPSALWPRIDEMSRLQARLERQAVEQLLHESELLTPEQRDRYFTHVQGRMQRGGGCGYGSRGRQQGRPGDGGPPGRGGRGRGRRGPR